MISNALAVVRGLIAAGVTKAEIGKSIGYSRSAVSLFAAGKYRQVKKIEAAILFAYERVNCPYLKRQISLTECAGFAKRACPTSIAREVRHWKTCQTCAHKPTGDAK